MKILIIGGTGNISRWFVPRLIEKHDVTLFNRGTSKVSFAGKYKTLIGDRTNYAAFEKQMQEAGIFDCVIDMVGFEPDDAMSAVRAFRGRTAQYIFCSTVDVFNKKPFSYPTTEQSEIKASETFPYAYKKVKMEDIFQEAYTKGDFPLTIIRPAATYSEGWSPLVTCFGGGSYHLDRLMKGKPVILHGDGSAIWVASHSEDVGKAFLAAIGNKKTIGKAYNVTGDELMTWHAMHLLVAKALGAPEPSFEYIPTNIISKLAPKESEWCVENFQFNNIFDNTFAKQELDFQYTIFYEEGTRRCIQYLQENNLIEDSSRYPFYDDVLARWKVMKDKL